MTLPTQSRIDFKHRLGRFSDIENDAAMGRQEEIAVRTPQVCFRDEALGVKSGLCVDLLLKSELAARAIKLPVEGFLLFILRGQFIFVSLDDAFCNFGVKFFEDAHSGTVTPERFHAC